MFKILFIGSDEIFTVHDIRTDGEDNVSFLIFNKLREWVWRDANNFKPLTYN